MPEVTLGSREGSGIGAQIIIFLDRKRIGVVGCADPCGEWQAYPDEGSLNLSWDYFQQAINMATEKYPTRESERRWPFNL